MLFAGQPAALSEPSAPVPALEGERSLSQQERLAPVQRCYAAAMQLQPRGGSGSCGVLRAQSTTLAYMVARAAQDTPRHSWQQHNQSAWRTWQLSQAAWRLLEIRLKWTQCCMLCR